MRASIALLVAVSLAACAPRGAPSTPHAASAFTGRSASLTADQIGQTSATTLDEAIQSLRPRYLSSRGLINHAPQVYVDGLRYGDTATLRTIRVAHVQEVRFLAANEATLRFGGGHMAGAILVTTWRGR